MYTIKLADGTLLENLELNGNNYIADRVVEDNEFVGRMKTVTISDGEVEVIYSNLKLLSNIERRGKSWLVFGEKTLEEIEKENEMEYVLEMDFRLSMVELGLV